MTTTDVYLERIDHARNMARYYRLSVAETLFGEWVMIREWGRIGSRGKARDCLCPTIAVAEDLLERCRRVRERRGYVKK